MIRTTATNNVAIEGLAHPDYRDSSETRAVHGSTRRNKKHHGGRRRLPERVIRGKPVTVAGLWVILSLFSVWASRPASVALKQKEDEHRIEGLPGTAAAGPSVLISVLSSRKEFARRVQAIETSWAQDLPAEIQVVYMVGAESNATVGRPRSQEDITQLSEEIVALPSTGFNLRTASKASVVSSNRKHYFDASRIVVLESVVDDEYPPVYKTKARVQTLSEMVDEFDWIFFADDDTYVHVAGLQSFLQDKGGSKAQLYGRRGFGRKEDAEGLKKAGLEKGFCMGGPGYIMSRYTLRKTAQDLEECVEEINQSKWRQFTWHSDVVVGLCAYKATSLGCWDWERNTDKIEDSYDGNRLFQHNYQYQSSDPKELNTFINSLDTKGTISAHPFKHGMDRIQNWAEEAAADRMHSLMPRGKT